MTSQDIRRAFLEYFAARGHKILPSSPLLPKDDPTILFTNAGMNQFKTIFLGQESRSYKRATTVQKCMRVSGKHNDLEQVGRTRKHHTFFEMLGNFSFGDYFKRDAILFAWELMTGVFALPQDRLYVTVYEEDDEAFGLWSREVGVPEARIFRLGKKDNFWAMGETGPCGPCSEIHYDQDPAFEPGTPLELIEKGSDRMVELWNLVFMQFFQDEAGVYHPLPKPSIDTGMGLERMASALQGKTSNFDTDLFRPLIAEIAGLAGRDYPAGDEGDVNVRVIADHLRAVAFMIGDGIMPANDGRGYVLRRLIRRAFRKGNLIGLEEPFVYKLIGAVADIMRDAYPELLTSQTFIARICRAEEERFARTLASGLRYFRQFAGEARERGAASLSGEAAFKLYDTFGFPLDLTQELAQEERLAVDETGFHGELDLQKERARLSWKGAGPQKERRAFEGIAAGAARFAGVDCGRVDEARILALVKDGARVGQLAAGESGEAVLDITPFYAEAGGQVGDAGLLKSERASASVATAYYPVPDVRSHRISVLSGVLREGETVQAAIDPVRRKAVRGNHTATHLLHAALRQTLGDHVKQAGSLVSASRLRFDFTHFQAVEPGELAQVERLVNEKIREDIAVSIVETTLEEGVKAGAMAIFEEKYGETVRMVTVGDFSRELCGGAHAPATGEIGLFKIVAETSVAAGMRRIEAVTAEEALTHVQESEALLESLLRTLGSGRREAPAQLEKLKEHIREKEREIKTLRQKLVRGGPEGGGEEIRDIRGIKVLVQKREGLVLSEARGLADALKGKVGSGVVILGAVAEDKAFLVVGVTKDLAGRISAADVIKGLAPLIGGGGGGRPDFAQAGGPRTEALEAALAAAASLVESLLK